MRIGSERSATAKQRIELQANVPLIGDGRAVIRVVSRFADMQVNDTTLSAETLAKADSLRALARRPLFYAPADSLAAYKLITEREPLSLFDVPGVTLVTPPSTTQATSTSLPLALPGPGNPTGDRLAGGQYIIYPDAAPSAVLPTPYLPDDAACGIALRRVPGVTQPMSLGPGAAILRAPNEELVLLVVFSGRWPERTGLRIVVQERKAALDASVCGETFADDGTPRWDPDARTLTVFVAKGLIPDTDVNLLLAWFLTAWTIFTFYMWVGSMKTNKALFTVFTLLLATFILLDIGHFVNPAVNVIGGYCGIVTALGARYTSAAGVINTVWGKTVLPLGPIKK